MSVEYGYSKTELYHAFLLGRAGGDQKDFVQLIKKIRWERAENERLKKRLIEFDNY